MPKKKTVTLANPEQPDAQAALDSYRPSDDYLAETSIVIFGSLTIYMMLSQRLLDSAEPAAILLYTIWGALILAMGLVHLRSHRRRRAYNRHVQAGNIITVDKYLVEAWDELRAGEGVKLSAGERQVEMRKLFGAAAELHDELQRHAQIADEPELTEEKLLTKARIRARLLREVEALRVLQEAKRDMAGIPAAEIDLATAEEVETQLRSLRARQTEPPVDKSGQEKP